MVGTMVVHLVSWSVVRMVALMEQMKVVRLVSWSAVQKVGTMD